MCTHMASFGDKNEDGSPRYWFRLKPNRSGWMPATPAGWWVTIGYIAAMTYLFVVQPFASENPPLWRLLMEEVGPFLILTALLLLVVVKKGEPWRQSQSAPPEPTRHKTFE
jgi:hypothetical protein